MPDDQGRFRGISVPRSIPKEGFTKEDLRRDTYIRGASQPNKSEPIYRTGGPLISTYEKEIAKLKSLLSLAYTHIPTKPGTRLVKDEIREVLRGA